MSNKKFTIVTTTINIPHLLRDYAKDAIESGRDIEKFVVVGDKKTPDSVGQFCNGIQREYGVSCKYLSVQDQDTYLDRWPEFKKFLPWNCIQRRNVGLLFAYFEGKADVVVTIDDDNFIHQRDYLGFHDHVGEVDQLDAVSCDTGWWNVCEMLDEEHGIPFYHRGHPLSKRWLKGETKKNISQIKGRAVVNAGLWMEEPDVDALTRLYFPINVIGKSKHFKSKLACDIGTWAPFNSQNTAISREAIPAYFLFPYVGRYDDIWASYIIRHISDYMGDYVTYGSPLVIQKRNPHNYFKDFDAERFGMEFTDIFLEALKNCALTKKDYRSAFAEIAEQFPNNIKTACSKRNVESGKFEKIVEGFHIWTGVFE